MEQAGGSPEGKMGSWDTGVPLVVSLFPLNSQTLLEQRSGGSGKGNNKVRPGQRIEG